MRFVHRTTVAGLALVATSVLAQAQGATPIAISLLGCWESTSGSLFAPTTCVTLGPEVLSLRVVSVLPGGSSTESLLRLDGSRQPVEQLGCTGWEETRPSADGERILISAETRCGSAPTQRLSGAILINPQGEWVRVQGSGVYAIANASIEVLRPVSSLGRVPTDLREAVGPLLVEAEASRERLRRSRPTATDLFELEEAKVAEAVIDIVVAAGHPKSFNLGLEGVGLVAGGASQAERGRFMPTPTYFGFGYPGFYMSDLTFMRNCGMSSSGFYDPRFCSAYSYGGNDYWRQYRGDWWTGINTNQVVVIRPVESSTSASRGRVVRGEGYTNSGSNSSGRTAEPRGGSGSGSSGSSTGASSGTSSGTSSGSSSGSSSSSGTRTAQPRKP